MLRKGRLRKRRLRKGRKDRRERVRRGGKPGAMKDRSAARGLCYLFHGLLDIGQGNMKTLPSVLVKGSHGGDFAQDTLRVIAVPACRFSRSRRRQARGGARQATRNPPRFFELNRKSVDGPFERRKRGKAFGGTVETPGEVGDFPFQGCTGPMAEIRVPGLLVRPGGAGDQMLERVRLIRRAGQSSFEPRRELPVRGFDPLAERVKVHSIVARRQKPVRDRIRGVASPGQGPISARASKRK